MATKQDESAVHRRVEDLLDKLRSGSKNAQNAPGDLSRRNFLRLGALGGAAASLTGLVTATSARAAESAPDDLNEATIFQLQAAAAPPRDRKSTRLNSSHGSISYAVFCLKKKKKNK